MSSCSQSVKGEGQRGYAIESLSTGVYRITNSEGAVILKDPYLNEHPASPIKVKGLERVGLLCVTHPALDHLGDVVREGIPVGALPSHHQTSYVWFAI
jgi:L-ascorbate metabolism protein UlaG (beta-lactamase superfamily)